MRRAPSRARAAGDIPWRATSDPTYCQVVAASPVSDPLPRVSRVDRGICDVLVGDRTVRARWSPTVAAAAHASPAAVPCVGDVVRIDAQGGETWLAEVLPRHNAITRASVHPGSSEHQVLAANVDVLAICEPAEPSPAPGRVERLLALAWEAGTRPVVVLTKTDLADDLDRLLASLQRAAVGAEVLAVSAIAQEGVTSVGALAGPGETLALLGPSGAGKSTLLNALLGHELMATSRTRSDGKGRHTTAHRELLPLPNGSFVIDTPGLRSIGLASTDGLSRVFPEIDALAASCRFGDCAHDTEPGCAVLAAVDDGTLLERRLASYRKLLREAAYQERRGNARLMAEERAKWKSISKQLRGDKLARP